MPAHPWLNQAMSNAPTSKRTDGGANGFEIRSHRKRKCTANRTAPTLVECVPGQFMDLSGRMGYKIFPGDVIQTQVMYQDVRMLEKRGSDGGRSCSREVFDECLYRAITERMWEEVGCSVPWVLNNTKYAQKRSLICIIEVFPAVIHWLLFAKIL